ncbi:protein kinase domain-containing protein [Paludibaculum fermentans]|uniref:protein kinase domain-containing protein n=1 Tax=Paludibaculum fermentans TaxID=1473598 RepID=UPI003EB97873
MTTEEWARLRQYFEELRELDEDERESVLTAIRLTEPELARELQRLLAFDERTGPRLIDTPIPDRLAVLLSNSGQEAPPPPDLTGLTLKQRYQVVSRLAQGGSSDVWLAQDLHLSGRKVVIKTPHSPLSSGGFQCEVEALAAIHHPAIARPLDSGTTENGSLFLVLEWVDGQSLRELLRSGIALERRQSLALISDLAGVLDEVHRAGVLHLDVKPENVMVRNSGGRLRAVLVDFGIARLQVAGEGRNALRGSPAYMAPERFEGVESRAADIYGLALVALELLSGLQPGETTLPSRLSQLRPKALRRALAQALEADPELRPESAGALSVALLHAVRQPRTWLMAALTAGMLVVAASGLHEFHRRGQKEQELGRLRSSLEKAQIDRMIVSMDSFERGTAGKQLLQLAEAADSDSTDPATVQTAAETLMEAGMQYGHPGRRHMGMSARAEATLRRGVRLADRAVQISLGSQESKKLAARARDALASVLIEEGRYDEAGKVLEEGLEVSAGVPEADGVRAGLLGNLSRIAFHNHDYEECLRLRNEFVRQRQAVWIRLGSRPEGSGDYAGSLATRGYLLREMGQYEAAMRDYQESDRLLEDARRVAPQNQLPIWQLARNSLEEGRTLVMAGSPLRGSEHLWRAASTLRNFAAQDPNDQATARQLALSLAWLAKAQKASGRQDKDWRPVLDEAQKLASAAVEADPASAKASEDLRSVQEIANELLAPGHATQLARK